MLREFASVFSRPFALNGVLGCLLLWLGQGQVFADQSVTLTWVASADTNAVGYKVYYGGASGVYTNAATVGLETSVTVSGLSEGATYYFSATTVSASGAESAFSNEAVYVITNTATTDSTNTNSTSTATNNTVAAEPPTLDPVASLAIYENAGPQTVNLTGIGAGAGGNAAVAITAASSDPTLISAPVVNYAAGSTTGTLTFAPVTDALGTAIVTVTVNNGAASSNVATQTFAVTVTAAAVAATPVPTLAAITNLTVYQNAGVQTVPLTGISAGSTNGTYTVSIWGYSSDATIIPAPVISYASPDSTGTLTFAPAPGALGTATVEVKVNNGVNNFSQDFTITVAAAPATNYPPTLNAIANLAINQNAGLQTVLLTNITSGSSNENQTLTVTAVSSDATIIPAPTVNYSSPNNSGTLAFAPVTNAVGSATLTVTVNDGGASNNTVTRQFTVKVTATGNQAPTLDPVASVTLIQGTASESINLTGISSGAVTEKQLLKVTAVSSNVRLIPTPVIRYASPASNAVLTLRPAAAGLGSATITVTVTDSGKSNNVVKQSFTVTLVANQPPTLDAIANTVVAKNAGVQTVALTGITCGSASENQTVKVSATSSNPRFVPVWGVQYTNPATAGTLTFKPAANFTGQAVITVTVSDGAKYSSTVRQHFTVTVAAPVATSSVVLAPAGAAAAVVAQPDPTATLTNVNQASGQFSFEVTGLAGAKYVVQGSPDLVHWTSLQTNTAPFAFRDSTVAEQGQQFYRAFYLP